MGNNPIHKLSGTFRDFFPPDDPLSGWLLRLMIIRDDVQYARRNLPVDPDDGIDSSWRTSYFLRALSISLLEAQNVFGTDLGKLAKKPTDEVMKKMGPLLQSGIAKLKGFNEPLKRVRDALGAHVDPQHTKGMGPNVVARVLENHPLLHGTVTLGGTADDVSYKELTVNALLFAWPDAASNEETDAKEEALRHAIVEGASVVVLTIDAILGYFWFKNGVLNPPEGADFGVRDRHNEGVYHAVKRPTKPA